MVECRRGSESCLVFCVYGVCCGVVFDAGKNAVMVLIRGKYGITAMLD